MKGFWSLEGLNDFSSCKDLRGKVVDGFSIKKEFEKMRGGGGVHEREKGRREIARKEQDGG